MHFEKFFDHSRPLHRKFFENVDVFLGRGPRKPSDDKNPEKSEARLSDYY